MLGFYSPLRLRPLLEWLFGGLVFRFRSFRLALFSGRRRKNPIPTR